MGFINRKKGMKNIKINAPDEFKIIAGTARSQAAIMVLPPHGSEGGPDNKHGHSDQWLYVISGNGQAIVEGRETALSPRTLLLIEAGERHEIKNSGDTPLETLNFYAPPAY